MKTTKLWKTCSDAELRDLCIEAAEGRLRICILVERNAALGVVENLKDCRVYEDCDLMYFRVRSAPDFGLEPVLSLWNDYHEETFGSSWQGPTKRIEPGIYPLTESLSREVALRHLVEEEKPVRMWDLKAVIEIAGQPHNIVALEQSDHIETKPDEFLDQIYYYFRHCDLDGDGEFLAFASIDGGTPSLKMTTSDLTPKAENAYLRVMATLAMWLENEVGIQFDKPYAAAETIIAYAETHGKDIGRKQSVGDKLKKAKEMWAEL